MTDDDKRQYHALRGKELTAYLTAFENASYAGRPKDECHAAGMKAAKEKTK